MQQLAQLVTRDDSYYCEAISPEPVALCLRVLHVVFPGSGCVHNWILFFSPVICTHSKRVFRRHSNSISPGVRLVDPFRVMKALMIKIVENFVCCSRLWIRSGNLTPRESYRRMTPSSELSSCRAGWTN